MLTEGQLELSDLGGMVRIVGPAAGLTVNAAGNSRVFQIDDGVTASLSGLSLTGGVTSGNGGGLYNDGGTTTLTGVTVSSNTAAAGGGVFNTKHGTITVIGCTISENNAPAGGGLYNYGGAATLADCTISGNTATPGGGVFNTKRGTITVIGCTISGNTAVTGGGIYNAATANLSSSTIGTTPRPPAVELRMWAKAAPRSKTPSSSPTPVQPALPVTLAVTTRPLWSARITW